MGYLLHLETHGPDGGPNRRGAQRDLGGWGSYWSYPEFQSFLPLTTSLCGVLCLSKPWYLWTPLSSYVCSRCGRPAAACGSVLGLLRVDASQFILAGATPLGVAGEWARMCQLACHYGRVSTNSTRSRASEHDSPGVSGRKAGLGLQIRTSRPLLYKAKLRITLFWTHFPFFLPSFPKGVANLCLNLLFSVQKQHYQVQSAISSLIWIQEGAV